MTEPRHFSEFLRTLLADHPRVRYDETPEEAAARHEREREISNAKAREARREILIGQGVPAKSAGLIAYENLHATPAVKIVRRWWRANTDPSKPVDERKTILVLHGPHDAGKTAAAGLAINLAMTAWLPKPSDPKETAPRLIKAEQFHKAYLYRDTSLDEERPVEHTTRSNASQLQTSALLVLDDLGQEAAGIAPVTGGAVEELIRLRSDEGRLTIITSNFTTEVELFKHMGERGRRFSERITEYGFCFSCPAQGYRGGRRDA